jgi:hypothetical protein
LKIPPPGGGLVASDSDQPIGPILVFFQVLELESILID